MFLGGEYMKVLKCVYRGHLIAAFHTGSKKLVFSNRPSVIILEGFSIDRYNRWMKNVSMGANLPEEFDVSVKEKGKPLNQQ